MIGTTAELKTWQRQRLDSADADLLTRLLNAATDYIVERTGQLWSKAAHTRYFDGSNADGRYRDLVIVPRPYIPGWYDGGSDDVVVTENGTALTVAVGYTTSADVLISYANDAKRRMRLRRRGTNPANLLADAPTTPGWATGYQNIAVTLNAVADGAPADLVQAAYALAALFHDDPSRLGKTSSSKAGSAASFEGDLPLLYRRAIESRAVA